MSHYVIHAQQYSSDVSYIQEILCAVRLVEELVHYCNVRNVVCNP
jgi:hypothetical protein